MIEVLLTILLFTVAVFGLLSNLTHDLEGIRMNRLGLWAKAAAGGEIERLMAQDLATIANGTSFFPPFVHDGDRPAPMLDVPPEVIPDAIGQLNICNYNASTGACGGTNSALKKVTVTVTVGAGRIYRMASIWTSNLAGGAAGYYPPSS